MLRSRQLLLALLAIGLVRCGDPAPTPEVAPEAPEEPAMEPVEPRPPVDHEAEARERALADWLNGCAVSDAFFVRHKLYTWTRADQIEALRADPRLLSRERSGSGELSLFDQSIADDDHPLARHLRRRGRRARRFAWVTPWATRMGWEANDYGDRLIEVTLREDAWTARYEPGAEPSWRVVDSEGDAVTETQVRRSPRRVGAVYHVASGPRAFREVVLVNENQIQSWAVATDAILTRVASDTERLRSLAAHWIRTAPERPEPFDAWLRDGWPSAPDDAGLVERYRQCLALGSEAYEPTPEHLEAIAAALDAMPDEEALEHTVVRRRTVGFLNQPISQGWCDPTMGCVPSHQPHIIAPY